MARISTDIAKTTKDDSFAMRTIAVMSIAFLPGTFVSVCNPKAVFIPLEQRLTATSPSFQWTCSIGKRPKVRQYYPLTSGYIALSPFP